MSSGALVIEGYANSQVDLLLAKATTDEQAWVWRLLRNFRSRFPQADHWTVNISPPDIRIGIRPVGSLKGKVTFSLYWYGQKICCSLRGAGDYRSRMEAQGLDWEINSSRCPEKSDVDDWFDSIERVFEPGDLRLQGNGCIPASYSDEDGNNYKEDEDRPMEHPNKRIELNQILFGPPGTGKTYESINAALEILDPEFLSAHDGETTEGRKALKKRFDVLAKEDRVRFVTFHQSFSYEDFVEGLRAESDGDSGQLRYEVVDGVFKSLCELAAAKVTQQAEAPLDIGQRRVWKMSLGNTLGSDASIFEECLKGNYVLLGYGGNIDFSGCMSRSDIQQRFADAGVELDGPNDYSLTSVSAFVTKMQPGDLLVVSDGNFKFRAIGEITGAYIFKPHTEYEADYSQMRPVKWLRQYSPSLPHTELLEGQFSQMTLYELRSPTLNKEKLQALLGAPVKTAGALFQVGQRFGQGYVVRSVGPEVVELDKPRGGVLPLPLSLVRQLLAYVRAGQLDVEDIRQGRVFDKVAEAELEKYMVNGYQALLATLVESLLQPQSPVTAPDARVLIIDEINRGNISRIFGELITLIEPSKRAGAEEALEVLLPYSKKPFSVPDNVYLIGTMNTADRSLAGLDIALRRRFTFREMPPRPDLLDGVTVDGVDVGALLRVMNQRIEVLLGRDYCLGHAYFMELQHVSDDEALVRLGLIFRQKVLPLLQEYFFEDWERIGWVLNDQHAKDNGTQPFIRQPAEAEGKSLQALFGSKVAGGLSERRWELNDEAFASIDSYRNICRSAG